MSESPIGVSDGYFYHNLKFWQNYPSESPIGVCDIRKSNWTFWWIHLSEFQIMTSWTFWYDIYICLMNLALIICRAGDYKMHSVHECVCHVFKKGCTSHWLFLLGLFNVLWPYCLCLFIWRCFFRPRSIAKWVIAMVASLSKVVITPKRLHLEHFCKIRCSATFSMPTKWYHF